MKDKAEAGPDAVAIKEGTKMKMKKTCVVCGREYIKINRKDSRSVCSPICYQKLKRREERGLPISNEEFKRSESERRKEAARKEPQNPKPEIYFKRDDPDKVCTCKHKDCRYMAKQNLRTCDYMLITGEMRGCPVEGCTKYKPGKIRRNTYYNNLL